MEGTTPDIALTVQGVSCMSSTVRACAATSWARALNSTDIMATMTMYAEVRAILDEASGTLPSLSRMFKMTVAGGPGGGMTLCLQTARSAAMRSCPSQSSAFRIRTAHLRAMPPETQDTELDPFSGCPRVRPASDAGPAKTYCLRRLRAAGSRLRYGTSRTVNATVTVPLSALSAVTVTGKLYSVSASTSKGTVKSGLPSSVSVSPSGLVPQSQV